jgi:hypothetical protein
VPPGGLIATCGTDELKSPLSHATATVPVLAGRDHGHLGRRLRKIECADERATGLSLECLDCRPDPGAGVHERDPQIAGAVDRQTRR